MEIKDRILKDMDIFSVNMHKINSAKLSPEEKRIVELAEMYAKDSKSWLNKGDLYTAFSSISYAHGLLDSIRKLKGME